MEYWWCVSIAGIIEGKGHKRLNDGAVEMHLSHARQGVNNRGHKQRHLDAKTSILLSQVALILGSGMLPSPFKEPKVLVFQELANQTMFLPVPIPYHHTSARLISFKVNA